jgi:N-acetylneuraminic acid mutarotase
LSFSPETGDWVEIPANGAPTGRLDPGIVWTGDEMIVWGGDFDEGSSPSALADGAAYSPASSVWRPLATANEPQARAFHTMVWTGEEVIVWSGSPSASYSEDFTDTGGAYSPAADSWRTITTENAPEPRINGAVVWTGSEVIVWGGEDKANDQLGDGAAYDPVTDSWRTLSNDGAPAPRERHSMVWTGREAFVFGGLGCAPCDIAAYDPATDSWRSIEGGPIMNDELAHGVWSGSEVLIWVGTNTTLHARYDVQGNRWRRMASSGSPSTRDNPAVHWTGTEMLVFGGNGHLSTEFNGALFTP